VSRTLFRMSLAMDVRRVPYGTSTAGLSWTACDSHTAHDMLPQHQLNITK